MSERRMFTKKVTDDDNFMSLSSSAQALYLHLSMSADDDGFSNQVSVSMFKAHASVGDLQALLEKRYIYQFENGVIVIKHWRMANALRKDRYMPTAFQEELKQLQIKDNGSYTRLPDGCQTVAGWLPDGCQTVAKRLPQDSIDKNSIDKDNINISKSEKRFIPPTLEEVKGYVSQKKLHVEPEAFFDYFTEGNWIDSKGNKVKNWKQKILTWEKLGIKGKTEVREAKSLNNFTTQGEDVDFEAFARNSMEGLYKKYGE